MKRVISILLILIMIFACCQSISAADSYVTRGKLAYMLATAKDEDEASQAAEFSVFSDVSKANAYAQAIYMASREGWMLGYTDGSFKPNNNLKLEEVCCAVLKYTGFNSKNLRGSFKSAYVEKAKSLGYLDGITASLGGYVTINECETILHNAGIGEYATDGTYIGLITSYNKSLSGEDAEYKCNISVVCLDGVTRNFTATSSGATSANQFVMVNVSGDTVRVSLLSTKSIYGKINTSVTALGSKTIAADVDILEIDEKGNAKALDPEILAGVTLKEADVKYYTTNAKGEINALVLNDVTGYMWSYYICTSARTGSTNSSAAGTYSLIENGKNTTLSLSNMAFGVNEGPLAVKYNSLGTAVQMYNLESHTLSSVNTNVALSGNVTYGVADDVQVYIKTKDGYTLSNITAINASIYSDITGYCDTTGFGLIRIIICK